MKKVFFILIIIFVSLYLYGRYMEPNNIKVKEYTIYKDNIPSSYEDLKIVHFSDLLYDKDSGKLNVLAKKINKEKPDILVFSGNLFGSNYQYKEKDYNELQKFLSNLEVSQYKYAVIGKNDLKYINKYKDILYEAGFILLNNQNHLLFYKDLKPINIIGITDLKDINSLFTPEIESGLNIVISNKSDTIKDLKSYNVDIMFSGNSLGGIINIPYYGGLITKEGSKTYINDYYEVGNTDLFVSNGLGYINFKFRLFNTPSFNTYRIISNN